MAYVVDIRRVEIGSLLDIRGPARVIATALRELGLELPARPNTFSVAGDLTLLRVGEARWLLRASPGRDFAAMLSAIDRGPPACAVDVSDAYAMYAVTGADAVGIVAQGSPLDVHPSAFPANGATFTEFFGLTALVVRRDGGFVVAVEASYADYVEAFLARAAGDA